MSSYILCQVKRAALPYYIENISTNIYSMEELCFYLYHNIYLLDSTIINEELCFWIRDELGLKKLGQKLYGLLDENLKIGDFILPIFKEINYLSLEEFRQLNQQIQKLSQEPPVLRQKMKGDYLMEHRKYVNAIKVYQKALHEKIEKKEEQDVLGAQFIGEIYHNMGCAYARMFQMEEAVHCFSIAYNHLRTYTSIKSYLYGIYMEHGMDAFEKKAEELGVDEQRKKAILKEAQQAAADIFSTCDGKEYKKALEEKKKGNQAVYQKMICEMLEKMTREYHRSTGY